MNKEKFMNKFIDHTSQGVIFYKTPFLPSEINAIFHALKIEEDIKKRIEECKTNSNKLSIKTQWKEYVLQEQVGKELQEIIENKK